MNWNDLPVFIAIADTGSLSGASRQLGVNHSTVFRRLGALEEDLGVRLFERMPDGYILTSTGEQMLHLARDAEAAIDKIHLDLAGREMLPRGKVRVTTAPNLAHTVLTEAARKLRRSFPDITLEIAVGDNDYDLNRREADIALRATSSPPENLVGKRLRQIDWWVCSAKRASKIPGNRKQLGHQALIGADAALMRLSVFQWLEENYSEQVVARANDLSTMAALAREGIGLALLPDDQKPAGLNRLFRLPEFAGELWLLTHPDLRFAPRIRAVWEAIESAAEGSS